MWMWIQPRDDEGGRLQLQRKAPEAAAASNQNVSKASSPIHVTYSGLCGVMR